MEDSRNKKNSSLRNNASSTPAHLLASVLEQRYSHKSTAKIKDKDEKPDPMTFPAVQKALGPMYSTIVEIVEEETENEEVLSEDGTEGVSSINVKGLNEQLLNMVDEIEQNDREREKEKKAVVIEVQKKKEDPYNRSVNYHSTSFDDLDTIEISDDVAIETIVSESGRRKN